MTKDTIWTPGQIQDGQDDIDSMSREDMCRLWRFAPTGHPYFDRTCPLSDYFEARFRNLGGFSPEISKRIGW